MESIGCPETSVTNYQSTLRNIPEDGRPHLQRDRSMKQRIILYMHSYCKDLYMSCHCWKVRISSFLENRITIVNS
jgi:hypothetical protein